jgi:hypothetical protein
VYIVVYLFNTAFSASTASVIESEVREWFRAMNFDVVEGIGCKLS